jgi:hypothetical protein
MKPVAHRANCILQKPSPIRACIDSGDQRHKFFKLRDFNKSYMAGKLLLCLLISKLKIYLFGPNCITKKKKTLNIMMDQYTKTIQLSAISNFTELQSFKVIYINM